MRSFGNLTLPSVPRPPLPSDDEPNENKALVQPSVGRKLEVELDRCDLVGAPMVGRLRAEALTVVEDDDDDAPPPPPGVAEVEGAEGAKEEVPVVLV